MRLVGDVVIGAIVGSAAMLVACALWERRRNVRLSTRDWVWLAVLALVAPLLHIAMDAFDTYGVHPWWPIDNRWFYGDSVFIVEPLFWASAASLAFIFQSLMARVFVVLCLVAGRRERNLQRAAEQGTGAPPARRSPP